MNEQIVSSKKINQAKKLSLAWIVIAIILVFIGTSSFLEYSEYKEGQEAAVSFTLAATNKFNSYKSNYAKMVREMYDFYNPHVFKATIKGVKFDNSAAADSAKDADYELGKLMSNAGYSCHYGSTYLRYVGFIDYTLHRNVTPWIVGGGLVIVMLFVSLWHNADAKKAMIIDTDRIICMKGKKTVNEFMIKDVTSVQSASKKGLVVRGNSIKYKINYLENAEELKSAIMTAVAGYSADQNTPTTDTQTSITDELKKLKELLDAGVLTQDEFDAKKKQILGL